MAGLITKPLFKKTAIVNASSRSSSSSRSRAKMSAINDLFEKIKDNITFEDKDADKDKDKNKDTDQIKTKLDDFLRLYHWIIVIYSRWCFKRNSEWNYTWEHKQCFEYGIANETKSHTMLLEIQSHLIKYKNAYLGCVNTDKYIKENKDNILEFVNQSIIKIITIIVKPVLIISYEIKEIIKKYESRIPPPPPKKSKYLNYEVLKTLNLD